MNKEYVLMSLDDYGKIKSDTETHYKILRANDIYFIASVMNILYEKKCHDIHLKISSHSVTLRFITRHDKPIEYVFNNTDFDRYLLHAYQFCVEVLKL